MQVFQTSGEPPSRGSTILAIIGWTTNSSAALTSIARAKTIGTAASFRSSRDASP